ncbi:UNVERIFIED_CONTAM: hypothetical protein Sindi_1998700 [Sesamum indicum]
MLSFIAPTVQNGETIVRPSLDTVRDGSKCWKTTAVGYFLGKKPYYHHLKEYAHSMWQALREVTATANGFFFFQFKTLIDMENVIEGGPWLFQGQPIVLQKWEPGMAMRKLQHKHVPVWIKLRHLPMEYWTIDGLSTVASGVGKPLYPDAITRACTRLDFAREWLPPKCTNCMTLHMAKDCPLNKPHKPSKAPVAVYVAKTNIPLPQPNNEKSIKSMRPTMVDIPRREEGEMLRECKNAKHDDRVWDENFIDVHVLDLGEQFVQCRITSRAVNESVIVTVVYGATEVTDRHILWTALETLAQQCSDVPWLVGGDFNAVRDLNEVCGISGDIRMATPEFNTGILEACLIPLLMQVLQHGHLTTRHWFYMGIHNNLMERRNKGDLTLNVQLAKGFLDEAQQLVSSDRQNELYLLLEYCCRIVYAKATKLEQIMLQQRAKMQWMKDGDQCSRVFFRGTRRRLRPGARHCITDEEASHLLLPLSPNDVKQAVFDIAEDKAPGPDGYSLGFFKAAWPVVGEEVTRAVLDFFSTEKLLKHINSTILALIPKVHTPMSVNDFRPISCCNVLYKIIVKLLVQRLSVLLDKIISPYQTTFTPGRSIGDNIMLAQELFSGYNQMRLPPRCALKVDIRKAYDTVEWDFFLAVLQLFGFPPKFTRWIEECVSTTSFLIGLNGRPHGFFFLGKGK